MIKKYNQFINESNEDIDSICKKYRIRNYNINTDGTVDVDGSVYLQAEAGYVAYKKLPLKFGKVTGHFFCYNNKLTNLEGCPKEVGGDFRCYGNELTTLKGAPVKVGGEFHCDFNKLTNLEGCPKEVGSTFYCQNNKLTSLKGAPDKVNGEFCCNDNKLISFKHLPLTTNYNLDDNPIYEFLQYLDDYGDDRNLGEYLRLFEDIVQYPYLDDLEFEELAKCLKIKLPEDWRDYVTSYKMLSKF